MADFADQENFKAYSAHPAHVAAVQNVIKQHVLQKSALQFEPATPERLETMSKAFPAGSVGHILTDLCGVWHDHIEVYSLDGTMLPEDAHSGTPGSAPWDNLVYIDFDGEVFKQTNVTFKGREPHHRSFSGRLVDGVLIFDKLGPNAPEHIGVSAGPDMLIFAAREVTDGFLKYSEPDFINLSNYGRTRTRTTLLYRNGKSVRTLRAMGTKIRPTAESRVDFDPRGPEGPVHELREDTQAFRK